MGPAMASSAVVSDLGPMTGETIRHVSCQRGAEHSGKGRHPPLLPALTLTLYFGDGPSAAWTLSLLPREGLTLGSSPSPGFRVR